MAAAWRYRNTQEVAGLKPSSVSACDGSTSNGTGLCKSVLGSQDVLLQRSESTGHTETGSGLDQDAAVGHRTVWMCNMTLEETGGESSTERMDSVAQALEEVLSSALPQGCITAGVYEAAKSLNADPDNVVLCLLAAEHEDVALQIHFTLIQAFCCENDINILRVGNMRRLAEILGGVKPGGEPMDLHCVLVTNPQSALWKDPALSKVNRFCSDSRCLDQWVPLVNLPDR